MTVPIAVDIHAAITAEFNRLADVLEGIGETARDRPSLCDGWRVREVVAHMTMAVRYSPSEQHLLATGGHSQFGFDATGLRFQATDADWTYGSGRSIAGRAADLVLLVCGRSSTSAQSGSGPDGRSGAGVAGGPTSG